MNHTQAAAPPMVRTGRVMVRTSSALNHEPGPGPGSGVTATTERRPPVVCDGLAVVGMSLMTRTVMIWSPPPGQFVNCPYDVAMVPSPWSSTGGGGRAGGANCVWWCAASSAWPGVGGRERAGGGGAARGAGNNGLLVLLGYAAGG